MAVENTSERALIELTSDALTGWLLDIYPNYQHGHLTLWLLGDDGQRHHLHQRFPVVIYAGGQPHRLHDLGVYLKRAYKNQVKLAKVQRKGLLDPEALTVMEIRVEQAAMFPRLFQEIERPFVDVDFYDTDIRLHTRYAAAFDVFPLTRCRVVATHGVANQTGWVEKIESLESRWHPDPPQPALRTLSIAPDCDPFHAHPKFLRLAYKTIFPQRVVSDAPTLGTTSWLVPIQPGSPLPAKVLREVLQDYDPDVLVTQHGDVWVLPYLLNVARKHRLDLPLNRDPDQEVTQRNGGVHYTYGQVVRRGPQTLLHGRLHIDLRNTLSIGEMAFEGVLETARVGGLPIQTAARTSPGATLTSMKMITYLRRGLMVPNFKQQTEDEKDILTLTHADKGGLIFAPVIGLHSDVVEVDFTSMFPRIAQVYDISPETLDHPHLQHRDPRNGLPDPPEVPGMLGATLDPLLDKRQYYKTAVAEMDIQDPRYHLYKPRFGAHKSIGVVAYGRTKFRKETDGKVEVHEGITDYSRKSVVLAKLAAEALGYRFLHGYVDALYLQKPGGASADEIQALLDAITKATGLPIVLEDQYRWFAFLPSKRKPQVGAANRFFGVTLDGRLKVRGLASRRGDMPEWVARIETEILELLAQAPAVAELPNYIPKIITLLRQRIRELRAGETELSTLVLTQKLSKAPEEYRAQTSTVRAAKQLHAAGKHARIADYVRYVYVRGPERVRAWDLPEPLDSKTIDVPRYIGLLIRAAAEILGPLGAEENTVKNWLVGGGDYLSAPGILPQQAALPLFAYSSGD